jgi:hypothetical protein
MQRLGRIEQPLGARFAKRFDISTVKYLKRQRDPATNRTGEWSPRVALSELPFAARTHRKLYSNQT